MMEEVIEKKTVVIGASENPERYSYKCVLALQRHNHRVAAVGVRGEEINGVKILKGQPEIKDVDTITLYLSAQNQIPLYNYIFSLNPKRIIFNPGAENPELEKLAEQKNIFTEEACTLTLLATNQF